MKENWPLIAMLVFLALSVLATGGLAVHLTVARASEQAPSSPSESSEQSVAAIEPTEPHIAYASDLSIAQQALAMDDLGRAQRLLDYHRPAPGEVDLRGWEWRYLWNECRSDALGELCRYPYSAYSVASIQSVTTI